MAAAAQVSTANLTYAQRLKLSTQAAAAAAAAGAGVGGGSPPPAATSAVHAGRAADVEHVQAATAAAPHKEEAEEEEEEEVDFEADECIAALAPAMGSRDEPIVGIYVKNLPQVRRAGI